MSQQAPETSDTAVRDVLSSHGRYLDAVHAVTEADGHVIRDLDRRVEKLEWHSLLLGAGMFIFATGLLYERYRNRKTERADGSARQA